MRLEKQALRSSPMDDETMVIAQGLLPLKSHRRARRRFPSGWGSLLLAITLSLGFGVASIKDANGAEVSVVYVEVERVLNDVDEGRDANKVMEGERKKRQDDLVAVETELKKMRDALEKKLKTFSKEAIQKEAGVFQQKAVEYEEMKSKFNAELETRGRELYDPVKSKLKELLRVVANRDGYDMILSKLSVPYGRKDLDVTDKMIQEYNRTYPSKKGPAPAPADKKIAPPAPLGSPSVAPKMK
ncbi:MAG: hypothetical protein NVSMB1_18800 [Polyangiales bacterium]